MSDRAIRRPGFHNTRDLGGLPIAGGGTTRYGQYFRSADLRFVMPAGWQAALEAGVRTVLDLRNDDEAEPGSSPGATLGAGTFAVQAPATVAKLPAEMRAVRIPIDDINDVAFWQQLNEQRLNGTPLYFRPFVEAKAERIAAALTCIAQAGAGGVIFHCSAGRDRTGLVSLLLLSIAGVLPEAIAEDYELGLDQTDALYAALGVARREPSMHDTLQQHGTTVRAAVLSVLEGLEVTRLLSAAGMRDADVATLRARLA